jgi:myb proto-oncogene protein
MGIDPITHKPKNETLFSDNHSKNAANLSHMAQWESARLEAEARLVRESKLRSQYSLQIGSNNSIFPSQSSSSASSSSNQVLNIKEEGEKEWKGYEDSTHLLEFKEVMENSSIAFTSTMTSVAEDGFTNLLLDNSNSGDPSLSPESGGECNTCHGSGSGGGGSGSDFYEDNKNYWNNILNLVNSSPSNSPMF